MQQRGKRTLRGFIWGAILGAIIGSQAVPFSEHYADTKRKLKEQGLPAGTARTLVAATKTYKPVLKVNRKTAPGMVAGMGINALKVGGILAGLSWLKNRRRKQQIPKW